MRIFLFLVNYAICCVVGYSVYTNYALEFGWKIIPIYIGLLIVQGYLSGASADGVKGYAQDSGWVVSILCYLPFILLHLFLFYIVITQVGIIGMTERRPFFLT